MLLPKKQILSLLFYLSFLIVQSQTVKNFTIADGLPGNAIKCIFKDSKGLMWIATETGLCTYDGMRFEIIGEEHGLKYNLIWKITEDDKRNIWLSLYGNGVAKYDGKKFTYYDKKQGLINNAVRSLYFSKKYKCMVFGTEDGVSIFDGKQFKNFDINVNNRTTYFQVNFISEYKEKILFGVNHDKIYELKINPTQIQKSKIVDYLFLETKNYSGLIEGDNFYGHAFSNDFEVYNLKTHQKLNYGSCPVIWDYAVDNQKNVYASCWNVNEPKGGLLCLKNNKILNLSENLQLPTSLFWCLYFDKVTDQLWVGSVDQGVFVIDLSQKIAYLNKDTLGILKPEINSFCLDNKGNLWLGGNNFIAKKGLNGTITVNNKNLVKQIQKLIKNRHQFDIDNIKYYLNHSKDFVCQSIKKDASGTIWALTNYGLIAFDENLKVLKFQNYSYTGGVFDFINSKQILLFQNYNLGYTLSIQNLEKVNKIIYKKKAVGLDASKIFNGQQGLWIASPNNGLFLFKNGVLNSMNDKGFLDNKNIKEVFVDSKQNIISGAVNGKVYFSKWNNNRLSHFKILTPDKDLIGNSVFFIRQYENYYFIGTNKGLNIIKDFKLFKFIDKTENLQQAIYTDAQIDYNNKKLMISTNIGLINVDLKKIICNQRVNSPIQIAEIKINDKPTPEHSDLQLNYDQNNFEISFKSNNIYNATKNRYRYKIIGLNENWSSYSPENNLKLLGLNSGSYQLIIEGKNLGTNESIRPIKLNFIISPPFWKTSWFVIISLTVLILLIILYVKRKIKNIRNKAELEKRIAETKLQALQSQMNPHFVFNAMNSIQNFVIDNNTDEALWYISEFSKLMRQTLDFSSKITIRLEEEIDYLNRYIELENLRRKNKVIYMITVDKAIDTYEIEIPPMLIEPLIENVFIHAFDNSFKDCKLDISFMLENEKIICNVIDNGKGYDAKGKESKGLKLVHQRLELLKTGSKNILSIQKLENGTKVQLEISMR